MIGFLFYRLDLFGFLFRLMLAKVCFFFYVLDFGEACVRFALQIGHLPISFLKRAGEGRIHRLRTGYRKRFERRAKAFLARAFALEDLAKVVNCARIRNAIFHIRELQFWERHNVRISCPKKAAPAINEDFTMVALLHSLGGCGGTLAAQCLGGMPGALVLSETNPRSAGLFDQRLNPYVQLRQWYPESFRAMSGSFSADEMGDPAAFGGFIEDLYRTARGAGGRLVIRDYNYVDYLGVPFVEEPQLNSSLLLALKGRLTRRSAVLLRHPLRQFLSLRSHRILSVLTPQLFVTGYHAFLDDFAWAYVVKYEDLVANPQLTMATLCEYYQIPFSADAVDRHHEYHLVTGQFSRIAEAAIEFSKPPHDDEAANELEIAPGYEALLKRMAY